MNKLRISILIVALFFANLFVSYADTKQDIEKAKKNGNVVFLVFTEKGNAKNQQALDIAKKCQKLYSKSTVIELDRSNSSNADLIKKFRLAGAPVPLILVVGKSGLVAGGAPLDGVTAEDLVAMIPSPKEEILIKVLTEGNSAFVVFSKKTETKNQKQLDACQSACQNLGNKAYTIYVDVDDKNEKSFITKFGIDNNANFPITFVINGQGQVTSMLNGITEAKDLVSAATKKVSSGCCSPGSGKTCK